MLCAECDLPWYTTDEGQLLMRSGKAIICKYTVVDKHCE